MTAVSSSWWRVFWFCLVLFVLSHLFFIGTAILVHNNLTSNMPYSALFSLIDGYWYMDIAQHGYDVHARAASFYGHQNYVFFPLYPLVIKGVMLLTGLKVLWAGQLVSQVCFFTALCLFYRWMERGWGVETAQIGSLLLAFSPYNIYFMAIYTDALFLLLFLLFWIAAQRRQWWAVGVCGFCMSLTHPNGVLVFLFALWFAWDDLKSRRVARPRVILANAGIQSNQLLPYAPILLIPLGLLGFMAYLHVHVGDALAFVHNERAAWHRDGWHLAALPRHLARQTAGDSYNVSMYGLALALSGFLWLRGCRKEAFVIPVFTVMGLLSGSFVALARYSACLFPFYIALGLFVVEKRGLKIILAAEIIGSILLMYCWIEQAIPAF